MSSTGMILDSLPRLKQDFKGVNVIRRSQHRDLRHDRMIYRRGSILLDGFLHNGLGFDLHGQLP